MKRRITIPSLVLATFCVWAVGALLAACSGSVDVPPTIQPASTATPAARLPTAMPLPATSAPTAAPTDGETATVVRVVDGDTIEVLLNRLTYRVRYIGIDTPETYEPCYDEATAANRALVGGETVTLVRDVTETDRYGRLLRYVYVGDTFVNAELAAGGYAQPLTYPPDVRHSETFAALAAEAREAGLGCWAITADTADGGAAATPEDTACDCSGNVYNCADFGSHAEAQACYEACLSERGLDVHHLDGDDNGLACEALP